MNKTRNNITRTAMASMIGLSALALPATVDAQPRWGRPIEPRAGACFYRDFNFRGDFFCTSVGDDIPILSRGMDNEISSIRTFGNVEVTIFQDARYRGRWSRLEGDVRNLRSEGWNDRVSSISVDRDWGRRRNYERGNGVGRIETREWRRDDRNDRDDRRDDRIDRRGDRRDDRAERRDDRNDRRLTSAEADRIIRAAYREILDRDPDTAGLNLYRDRMLSESWTEAQVREALRTSPEYRTRNQMTQQKAGQIVAEAYRAVLNREPDPGSRGYVEKVLREQWTQADVERELRKSDEYRNRRR